jgi:hypothetical protein
VSVFDASLTGSHTQAMHRAVMLLILAILLSGWVSHTYASWVEGSAQKRDMLKRATWLRLPWGVSLLLAVIASQIFTDTHGLGGTVAFLTCAAAWLGAGRLPIAWHNYRLPIAEADRRLTTPSSGNGGLTDP